MENLSLADVSHASSGLLETDEFGYCMSYIEEVAARYPPGSDEENDFREHVLLEYLRNYGAPVTLIKALRQRYQGGPLNAYTEDLGEVIGLLIFNLKEESCIPSDETRAREKLLDIANHAFRILDEKSASSKGNGTIPSTVKEENDDDHLREERERSGSAESSESNSSEKSSEGESSDASKSRKEMNRLVEAKQYVSLEKISNLLNSLDTFVRRRVERFINVLHSVSIGSEDDSYILAEAFAPMFARPPNTAYMSIRHLRELPAVRLVLWVWIENMDDVAAMAKEPFATKSASSTPPPANRHLLSHHVKPRLSSVSSTGFPSPNQLPILVSNAIGAMGDEIAAAKQSSPSPTRHVRKKTPPRIADLSNKRKVDMDHLEMFIAAAVDMMFSDLDSSSLSSTSTSNLKLLPRVDIWLLEESGQVPATSDTTQMEGILAAGKRQWATKERVTIEKRVLKKRLLHWDKDFEQKNGRKPTREDRTEMRGVFHAYGALKTLLQLLETPGATPDALLIAEKKALQAVLRLFEKDFEERMKRKVEVASDIAGRELEYSRYKELKERLNQRNLALSEGGDALEA